MRFPALLPLLLSLSFFGACSREMTSTKTPSSPPQSTCNLQTPLQRGIPGSPQNLIKSTRNPNGDSELAVLMRKMLAELQLIRKDVLAGRAPRSVPLAHQRMLCVWPSEQEIRGPLFETFALAYQDTLNSFKNAGSPPKDAFNRAVSGCLSCHNNFCPGPIHLIENLWID